VWYIVYYDPDATAKAVEVKFGAGRKLHVKRPARIFELAGKSHLPMDQTKLKVDSDKAIETALKEPMLKNLKIRATRLTLERWEEKPVWKVQLWAAKLRKPTKNANIGEIYIACADGKVVRNKLKIQRVD
jgi:hypothetical protein